ncbi:hypothetical protein DUNSADRAFT_5939 [Dunaliella salina]|uniref:EngC GTPase domain-containing protein n=1 Tax=Dunaliella salina TaxID=3046 RepID=A0ABQ7GPA1_DUNSA|nr:hypothetical protein DUNSADRAFT_5939 [Dunaliella salina]|eukprot:KAF5836433.1 hypothetical protein DUNSADRAFT_5939 [Dunaliella salina]
MSAASYTSTNILLEAGFAPHPAFCRTLSHLSAGPSPRSAAHSKASFLHAHRTSPCWPFRFRQYSMPTTATRPSLTEDQSPSLAQLPQVVTGQVFSTSSNFVRVEVPDPGDTSSRSSGQRPLLCSMRALLRKVGQAVLVGDYVRVGSIDWEQNKGQVEDVQLSRFLVCMEASRIPFRLLLNKADLLTEEELQTQVHKIRSWGYEPLVVSSSTGQGMEEVVKVLQDKTSVVAGPSGAGKSSLINFLRMGRHRADADPALMPPQPPTSDRTLETSDISDELEGFFDIVRDSSSQGLGEHSEAVCTARNVADVGEEEESWGRHTGSNNRSASFRSKEAGKRLASSAIELSQGGEGYLAVGDLSKRGKGRHTTTTVTLIRVRGSLGGRLVDTPGFSHPSLEAVSASELAAHFPEMHALLDTEGPCRFRDCMHVDEPGCALLCPPEPQISDSNNSATYTASGGNAESPSNSDGTSGLDPELQHTLHENSSLRDPSSGNGSQEAWSRACHLASPPSEANDTAGPANAASLGSSRSASSSHEEAAAFSVYNELVPPSIAKLIEREGGVEEWLVEMQSVSDMGGGLQPVKLPPPPARFARHPIYLKFLAEIKAREETDVKTLQAGKRQREGRSKVKMSQGGRQRTEAKLQHQKHRRVSRARIRQGIKVAWDE